MNEDASFSRSGVSSAGGKLTKRLDVPVSEELEEACIAMAFAAGIPKAEFVRNIIERSLFGEVYLLRRISRPHGAGPCDESRSNDRAGA